MIAGFKATGVVPLDREKVLKVIPKDLSEGNAGTSNRNDSNASLDGTFETFLREMHTKEMTGTRKKRTRINVPAGKSVTNLEENVEAGPSTSTPKKPKPASAKSKKKVAEESESSCEEIDSYVEEISEREWN